MDGGTHGPVGLSAMQVAISASQALGRKPLEEGTLGFPHLGRVWESKARIAGGHRRSLTSVACFLRLNNRTRAVF